jgi:tRNA-Thr(GGU) m(6)t(6)A37 methyltransferase TsaA
MITLTPIAVVHSNRAAHEDDHWGDEVATITLDNAFSEEVFEGIESFSHLEIIFYMHKLDPAKICRSARHPRENKVWPKVGIFAQHGRYRPNQIGHTIVELVKREGRVLTVRGLDAIDSTPVLDIKPLFREFLPHGDIRQPDWVAELMKNYW